MKIKSGVVSGVSRLARIKELSREATRRLRWFDYYYCHGRNARLTCRHFGISPQTFYRWKHRYDPDHPGSLEDRSRRPRHVRQPTWTTEIAEAVLKLREEYPRWGKDKMVILLHEDGYQVSASMVGRMIRHLKQRGVLKEPVPNHISARKGQRQRPYAVRKPREYVAREPGDIVQIDTLDVRPLPRVAFKHFTARDVVSRWDIIEVYNRATARTAASFLEVVERRLPFTVAAVQVDGGSEFEALFEEECQRRGIRLFVLPPRSPKLNGHVERAHRTHLEEFYEVTESSFEIAQLRADLLEWERVYNTVRPHQALGYLTPLQFIQRWQRKSQKEVMCH